MGFSLRRGVAALVAVGAAAAAVGVAGPAGAAAARLSGADRYATSAVVAGQFSSASVVWVATGQDFPDALAAAPAAAAQGGPLLLTAPGALSAPVKSQLARLRPQRVVIAGGTGAVSAAVATQLKAYAPQVMRIAGNDRYDTSRRIADYAFGSTSTAYVVTGATYVDALSAGAAAASAKGPLLLVNGAASAADAATVADLS